MSHRRQAREMALQILYSLDVLKEEVDVESVFDAYLFVLELSETEEKAEQGMAGEITPSMEKFAYTLVMGIWQNLQEIDAIISSQTNNWNFERLAKTDKAVLRLACFELCHCQDIPHKVSINEAIELAKLYGEDNSPAFVNGILDAIALKTNAAAKSQQR